MSKSVKITLIVIAFLILGTLMHFGAFSNLPFIQNFHENAVLTINTRRGTSNVYLDGKDYGQTPTSITNLSQGNYNVELEKITEGDGIYPTQSFYIELYRGTEAVIDVEIGPDNFKSGHVLFYSPTPVTFGQKGSISIRSNTSDYELFINNERINEDRVISYRLEPDEYDLRVTSQGYESLEFPVIVRDGYDLNIRVYLLPIPIAF